MVKVILVIVAALFAIWGITEFVPGPPKTPGFLKPAACLLIIAFVVFFLLQTAGIA